MATARTEKKSLQIEVILDAARRSIATRGYAATSLARVAEEAGSSKRMVLYYFATREELISALVRGISDEMVALATDTLDRFGQDPQRVVLESFRRIWAALTADPTLIAAYFSVLTEAVSDGALAATMRHVREAYGALSDRLVLQASALGLVPQTDPAVFQIHVFAGLRGLLLEHFERGPSPELDQAVALFERSLVGAFAPPH